MSDTQVKFAPFGIGIHSMDSKKAKELIGKAAEKGATVGFVALGLAVIGGEIALRATANGLTHAANAVADIHDQYNDHVKENSTLQKAVKTASKIEEPVQAAFPENQELCDLAEICIRDYVIASEQVN